ncbi:MAG: hypothetical protein HY902_17960 [Deltaproteobacteria bacterium]|nr:hypothetical protein [Deltaproteobacteria bacterium]
MTKLFGKAGLALMMLAALAACSAPQQAWEVDADLDEVEARARADLREEAAAPGGRAQMAWLCLLHGRACSAVAAPPLDGAPTLERTVRVALLTDGLAATDRAVAAWCDVAQAALDSPQPEAEAVATAAARRIGKLGRADPWATKAVLAKRGEVVVALLQQGPVRERLRRARELAELLPAGAPTWVRPALQQATAPWSRRLLTGMSGDVELPLWTTATSANLPAHFVGSSGVASLGLAAEPPGIYHVRATWRSRQDDPQLQLAVDSARPLRAWLDGQPLQALANGADITPKAGLRTLDLLVPASADGETVWLGWFAREGVGPDRVATRQPLPPGLAKALAVLGDPRGSARRELQQWFPKALIAELGEVLLGGAAAEAADLLLGVWPRHADAVVSDAARHVDDGNAQLALRSLATLEPSGEGQRVTTEGRTDVALLQGRAYAAIGLDDLAAAAAEQAARRADGHCGVWLQALELATDIGNKPALRHILAGAQPCDASDRSLVQAAAWRAIGRPDKATELTVAALAVPAQAREARRRLEATQGEPVTAELPGWLRDRGTEQWLAYQALALGRPDAPAARREAEWLQAQDQLDAILVGAEASSTIRQRALQAGARAPWHSFLRDGKALAQAADDPSWASSASTAYLLDQEIVVLLPRGGALRRVHQVLRVLTDDAADQVGEVRVAQGADLEFARTLLADGTVVAAAATADKETISLRAVASGAAVEYAQVVLVEPEDPTTGATRLDPFLLQSGDGPTRLSEYVVLVPTGLAVDLRPSLRAPPPEQRLLPGWTAYIFRSANVPRARIEPRAVRPDLALPSVQVASRNSLAALIEPWDERLEAAAQATSPEIDKWQALLLAQPEGLPRWRYLAQRLARGVQHSHDGGAPGSPSAALQQQRGDRAAVFYSMLRQQGLAACMVRVHSLARQAPRAGAQSLDPLDFPMELVRFELADGPHWYDPGLEGGLLDHLRSGLRGRPALAVGCKTSDRRITTPQLGQDRDAREVTAELDWRDDGSVEASFREHLTGAVAAFVRQFLTTATADERSALFVELAKGVLPGAQVEGADIQGLADPDGPLDLRWTLRSEASESRRQTLALGLLPSELGKDFAALPARTMPLVFGHGQRQQLRLLVRSSAPLQPLPDQTGRTPHVAWQRRWQPQPGGAVLEWQVATTPGVVEVEAYREFAAAAQGADAAEHVRLRR